MSTTALLGTALATGFLGSLHCAAMCGPLALAGCTRPGTSALSGRSLAGYLLGRLASYAFLGAVVGHLGKHALCLLPLPTVQTGAMVLVAALFAWRGLRLLMPPREKLVALEAPRDRTVVLFFASLLPRSGLGLGLATGVLPCSMLVAAWTLAAGTESALAGAGMMAAFFVGSTPGLLTPLFGRPLLARAAALSPRLESAAWLGLALWVAARPLLNAAHHH
jgi:sulfite exporter TauE/SafE